MDCCLFEYTMRERDGCPSNKEHYPRCQRLLKEIDSCYKNTVGNCTWAQPREMKDGSVDEQAGSLAEDSKKDSRLQLIIVQIAVFLISCFKEK